MKILLLGANGRTGRTILHDALMAGDTVTAVVRSEDRLSDIRHERLEVLVGDVRDSVFLANVMSGHDVVISTLGPRKPTREACVIYAESAEAIVHAMQQSDVRRLMVSSTALLFPSDRLFDRFLRFIAKHNHHQASLMEDHITASDLDWTIARPGFLSDQSSKRYRKAVDAFPDGGGAISRAALADFMLQESRAATHLREIVGLAA